MSSGSSSSLPHYASYIASASFLATADTHHLGLVFNSETGSNLSNEIIRGSGNPVTFFAMEFKGDVVTEGAIP